MSYPQQNKLIANVFRDIKGTKGNISNLNDTTIQTKRKYKHTTKTAQNEIRRSFRHPHNSHKKNTQTTIKHSTTTNRLKNPYSKNSLNKRRKPKKMNSIHQKK